MLVDAAKRGRRRDPRLLLRAQARRSRSAPAACAWSRSRASRSCRRPARPRSSDGMVVHTQHRPRQARRRRRSSSSCSSTIRSTARSATRAASARCRTSRSAGAVATRGSSSPSATSSSRSSLSPLIAIDRERCILCYRCVRFSQEIAEDHQLVLLERGAHAYVATFDGHPYVAPFSGNIIELCPVGALTSRAYRFRARPWDIEGAGTVCTLCPAQCNVTMTVRDERVAARARARQRRGRRRLAVRQGPLRLPGDPRRRARSPSRSCATAASCARSPGSVRSGGRRRARPRTVRSVAAIAGGETTNEEGLLLARLMRDGLGSPTSTRAVGGHPAARPAARARATRRCRRPCPTSSSPTPCCARRATRRRRADPRPADPQGRAPQRRQRARRLEPPDGCSTRGPPRPSATHRAAEPRSRRDRRLRSPTTAPVPRRTPRPPEPTPQAARRSRVRPRDGGEDVVILWGERLTAGPAGAAAAGALLRSPTRSASPVATAPA